MPNRWAVANGNWSNPAIWSGSLIPTASDDVFANNFTVNVDTSFEVLTLRNTSSGSVITAGGSFNFNSGSISGSFTQGILLGAQNVINISATTGNIRLSSQNSINFNSTYVSNISHTGNCNVEISAPFFTQGLSNGRYGYVKSGIGNLIINGNIILDFAVGGGTQDGGAFVINNGGNTIINGDVYSGRNTTNPLGSYFSVRQNSGVITINGNIYASINGNSTNRAVEGSAILNINGNVIGDAGFAIVPTNTTIIRGNVTGSNVLSVIAPATAPIVVSGSVIAGAVSAITSTSAIFVNVSGSVISSATANAISLTNASSVVNLAGNMVNTSGKTAIYCQNLFLSNTDTTQAQFVTVGSQDRTLYSADTFPNLPSASNVRFGITYGPGSSNTGTLRMALPQDVRSGVLTDNTTGSAILSMESLSNEIQTSADPFAQRLRDIATVDTVGYLLTAFKK